MERRIMQFNNKISAWLRDRLLRSKPTMMGYLLPLNKHYESFFPNWYKCSSNVDTIGYGHTGSIVGLMQPPWTEEYAAKVLEDELEQDYLPQTIEACAKVGIDFYLLSAAQQAAIVSLCYNAGPKAISTGTWAQRFVAHKPRHEIEQAYYRWNKSDGKTSPGLVRRRFTEMKLFWEGKLNYDVPGWKAYWEAHK